MNGKPALARIVVTVTWNDGRDKTIDLNTEQLAAMDNEDNIANAIHYRVWQLLRGQLINQPTN
jgi:hypothetical protein